MDEILEFYHSNESYRAVVLFIMLYKVVLSSESAMKSSTKCHHSNESYCAVLSAVCYQCTRWF